MFVNVGKKSTAYVAYDSDKEIYKDNEYVANKTMTKSE